MDNILKNNSENKIKIEKIIEGDSLLSIDDVFSFLNDLINENTFIDKKDEINFLIQYLQRLNKQDSNLVHSDELQDIKFLLKGFIYLIEEKLYKPLSMLNPEDEFKTYFNIVPKNGFNVDLILNTFLDVLWKIDPTTKTRSFFDDFEMDKKLRQSLNRITLPQDFETNYDLLHIFVFFKYNYAITNFSYINFLKFGAYLHTKGYIPLSKVEEVIRSIIDNKRYVDPKKILMHFMNRSPENESLMRKYIPKIYDKYFQSDHSGEN